jgi:hypothetical protein
MNNDTKLGSRIKIREPLLRLHFLVSARQLKNTINIYVHTRVA